MVPREGSRPDGDSGRSGTGEAGRSEDAGVPPDRAVLLDAMLGSLATYLRMCGYDTAYALDRDVEADDRLAALARAEDRTLLTRDADLASRVEGAVLLERRDVVDQLRELRAVGFELSLSEPRRCSRCNGRLERLPDDAEPPPDGPDPADQPVWRCRDCGQHFWKGSHWDDVRERLAGL